jgi:hypothetical protein
MRKLFLLIFCLCLACPSWADGGWGAFWKEYKTGFNPIIKQDSGKVDKPYSVLATTLMSLNTADWATTRYAIDIRGAHEANPIMAPLVNHEPLGAIYKFGLIGPMMVLSARQLSGTKGKTRIVGYVMLSAEAGFYAWVVSHNIHVIQSMPSPVLAPGIPR